MTYRTHQFPLLPSWALWGHFGVFSEGGVLIHNILLRTLTKESRLFGSNETLSKYNLSLWKVIGHGDIGSGNGVRHEPTIGLTVLIHLIFADFWCSEECWLSDRTCRAFQGHIWQAQRV